MPTEDGKIRGDLRVTGRFRLDGMVTGSIVVAKGGSLHLDGVCGGTLFVEAGGMARVDGTVARDIQNHGMVRLRGMVNGNVYSKGASFERSPRSVVTGVIET